MSLVLIEASSVRRGTKLGRKGPREETGLKELFLEKEKGPMPSHL